MVFIKKNKLFILLLLLLSSFLVFSGCQEKQGEIGLALEQNSHAAAAFIALEKNWFAEEGINVGTYETYDTGLALAAAMARGQVQAAYICLTPAILAYANGDVDLKIIAGTHKFGYGMLVNPAEITSLKDLEKKDIRIGCPREGSAADVALHLFMQKHELDKERILQKISRLSPQKQIPLFIKGDLDVVMLPEHYASFAEACGFKMFVSGAEIWPEMQGSVLVVSDELIKENPELVEKMVKVNTRATSWVNDNPQESAEIMFNYLNITTGVIEQAGDVLLQDDYKLTLAILEKALNNHQYCVKLHHEEIQEAIDYLATLDYIQSSFPAGEILYKNF